MFYRAAADSSTQTSRIHAQRGKRLVATRRVQVAVLVAAHLSRKTGPRYRSSQSSISFIISIRAGMWCDSNVTCRLCSAGVPSHRQRGTRKKAFRRVGRLQQRLHFPAQRLVACTHLRQKPSALVFRARQRSVIERRNLPPALWIHCGRWTEIVHQRAVRRGVQQNIPPVEAVLAEARRDRVDQVVFEYDLLARAWCSHDAKRATRGSPQRAPGRARRRLP